jgi:hypothetical protein
MAEQQDADQAPPADKPGDMALANQMMTAYLYGYYTYKGGHVSAPEAMDHLLSMLQKAEGAAEMSKNYFDKLLEHSKQRIKDGLKTGD